MFDSLRCGGGLTLFSTTSQAICVAVVLNEVGVQGQGVVAAIVATVVVVVVIAAVVLTVVLAIVLAVVLTIVLSIVLTIVLTIVAAIVTTLSTLTELSLSNTSCKQHGQQSSETHDDVLKGICEWDGVESKGCKRMTPTGGKLEADTFNVICEKN
jgi:Mg2+/Co2+ transporter CorB